MPKTGLRSWEIKEKAIDVTIDRMRQYGFEKVRLVDVAKELDVSHVALYSHFRDKAALLDAVSERWLIAIDRDLEAICRKSAEPSEKIHAWMVSLHRAKIAKVKNDPELYKAFIFSTEIEKPFISKHMDTMHAQLSGLVREAIATKRLKNADPELMASIIFESMMAFNHPKLVAQYLEVEREKLLHQVLDNVLRGLKIQS
jgi:AcrR family transcriptional regulator